MNCPHRSRPRPGVLLLALGAALSLAAPRPLAAQPPVSPPFREEQQVTAVDVMVDVVSRRGKKDLVQTLPSYLAPEDFEVVCDGEPRPVVGVSAFGPAQHAPDREPWTVVLYFDRRLASPVEASWAAAQLVEMAERLTGLGPVEIVTADPEPRPILEATRDHELLASTLAEIALLPEGGDHELLTIRDDLLAELDKPGSQTEAAELDEEIDPAELAAFAVAEEKRIVRRQLDGLLTFLAARDAGARHVLFLASTGFDLEPDDFYRPALARHGKSLAAAGDTGDLEADVEALGRALAAYGWITFPLLPAPDDAAARGIWLGKWRLGKVRGEAREVPLDPTNPHGDTVAPVLLNFLNLTRKGDKDVKKAESFLELGMELAGQGDFTEAEQAFRMALFHFGDDRATAARQALALVQLGRALDGQGRRREAREAFDKARELDPESAAMIDTPLGELLDPLPPMTTLARATTGAVLHSAEALADAVAGLPYRVRVTYQLPGLPDGTAHPVEVRCKRRGCRLEAPGWTRSGTPDEVATARLRRWLEDDEFEGELKVKALLVPGAEAGFHRIATEVEVPPATVPAADDRGPELRLSLGFGDPESAVSVRHQRLEPRELAEPRRWSFETAVAAGDVPAAPTRGVAVVVEHLATGRWGATVVELPAVD